MTAPIDTLWLNPLAFPRNPYHHLVKHYHDGRLATGHVNDPELDARLVFVVLANQLDALGKLGSDAPDALTAYHYLTTRMENAGGFDAVFGYLRGKDSPGFDEASAAVSRMLEGRACEKRIEQTLGDTVLRTAIGSADEHLAQRDLAFADINQGHRADDSSAVQRHPEVAQALLIEARNIPKIGLRFERNRNPELKLLYRQNDIDHALGVGRRKRENLDHGQAPRVLRDGGQARIVRIPPRANTR